MKDLSHEEYRALAEFRFQIRRFLHFSGEEVRAQGLEPQQHQLLLAVKGLPAGEYLAVAVDYVEEGMWNDPEYLESIRRYGQKVTLGDADARAVSLKVVTPQ